MLFIIIDEINVDKSSLLNMYYNKIYYNYYISMINVIFQLKNKLDDRRIRL